MGPGAVGREIGAEVPFPFSPSSVLSPRVTPPILPMNPPLHPSDNFPIDHAYFLYCPLVLGFTSFPRLAENWSVVNFIWWDSSYGSNSMFQSKTHNWLKQEQTRSDENGEALSLSESVCSLTAASKLWLIKDNNGRISHRGLNRDLSANLQLWAPSIDR